MSQVLENIFIKNVDPTLKKTLFLLAKENGFDSLNPFLKKRLEQLVEEERNMFFEKHFSTELKNLEKESKKLLSTVKGQQLNDEVLFNLFHQILKQQEKIMDLLLKDGGDEFEETRDDRFEKR